MGHFHVVIGACSDCYEEQALPESFLIDFKRRKASGTLPSTSIKLPPQIQALWRQEALIAKQLAELFEEITDYERALLNGRFGLIRGYRMQLTSELLASSVENPIDLKDQVLGPEWRLFYLTSLK